MAQDDAEPSAGAGSRPPTPGDEPPRGALLWLRSGGLALAAAGCVVAAFPPLEWAVLAWFAPLLMIASVDRLGTRGRFAAGFLAAYASALGGLWWLTEVFGVRGAPILLLILGFYGGVWGALTGVARRLRGVAAVAWPAVAWCGVEYIRAEVAPLMFSWLSLGYTQQNALGLGLARVVGVYGISFALVFWASATWAAMTSMRPGHWRKAFFVVLALVPLASLVPRPTFHGESIGEVVLYQRIAHESDATLEVDPSSDAVRGADLVVFPEYSAFVDPMSPVGSWFREPMQRLAQSTRWGVMVGAIHQTSGGPRGAFENSVFHFGPDGALLDRAVKNRPIPMMRDGLPAGDVTLAELPGARSTRDASRPLLAGVQICYDGSFQVFSRRLAQRGAEVLIVPTFNARAWGAVQHRQHQRMFQMRAMETGLTVLSAAESGPTFGARPDGSVIAQLEFNVPGPLRVGIAAPTRHAPLFVFFGWWVGPACMIAVIVAIGHAALRAATAPRPERKPEPPTATA